MKVLIVGSGGREHAIAVSMHKSKRVSKLFCVPGNAGIAQIAECEPSIGVMEFDKVSEYSVPGRMRRSWREARPSPRI